MSPLSRRLLLALRLLACLLIALHLLTPLLPEEQAWGLWPYIYLPVGWRLTLALGALLTVLPAGMGQAVGKAFRGAANSAWHGETGTPAIGRLSCVVSGLRRRRWLLFALVALAFAPLFWLGRIVHTRWGDAYILVHAIPHPEAQLTYNWQAPLTVLLHAKFWALGHSLLGWTDAMPAYWVLSSVAGVGFVFLLCCLAETLGRNRTEKLLTFGLVASLGSTQLFFGYIENYTLICVGIMAYLWLALRALRGEIDLWWAAAVLALTHAFHPSTLVLQPSLWYLGWMQWREKQRTPTATLARVLAPSLVVGLAVLALMESGGHGLNALLGHDFPGGADRRWFVPLFRTTSRWEHYTMLSPAHLLDIVNQQILTAPVVLPSLIIIGLCARRRLDFRAQTWRFLLLAAGCYLALTLVWNPDYGGRRDWDLFAPASLPLTVLLAWALPRALAERHALAQAGWCLVAVQVMHTAAWVYQNTLPWSWP